MEEETKSDAAVAEVGAKLTDQVAAPVPSEREDVASLLPPGAYADADGNVWDRATGALLGRIEEEGDEEAAAREAAVAAQEEAILEAAAAAARARALELRTDGRLYDERGEPVELPEGVTVAEDGRLYDASGAEVQMQMEVGGGGGLQALGQSMMELPSLDLAPTLPPLEDATRYGLPPGHGVGPDGTVYDARGTPVGFLDGYAAPPGAAAAAPPVPVVDGQAFGLPAGHAVGPDGAVYDASGALAGHLDGYAQAFGATHPRAPPPRPVVRGDLASGDEKVREEATLENGQVYVGGLAVGSVQEDGGVVAEDGTVVGRLPEEARQVVAETQREEEEMADEQVVAKLLHVAARHREGAEAEGEAEARALSLDDAVNALDETWRPYEAADDADAPPPPPEIDEPAQGMEPVGFKAAWAEKRRGALKAAPVVPSRFTRPFLRPDFPAEEKVMDERAFAHVAAGRAGVKGVPADLSAVRLVWLKNLHKFLPGRALAELGPLLSRCTPNLEVLGLCSSELRQLDLDLPRLLRLDVRYNRIKRRSDVRRMLRNTPLLQSLDVSGNPVMHAWSSRTPEPENPVWRTLLALQHLDFLNGAPVPGRRRAEALLRNSSKALRETVARSAWHSVLNRHPDVAKMRQWEPELVTAVDAHNRGLVRFNVAAFTRLEDLDLSNNMISTLEGSGLHLLLSLRSLDLAHNDLDRRSVAVVALLPSLLYLSLEGNYNIVRKKPAAYRLATVYATRMLRGTNRSPGLQELDGRRVTTEERVRAVEVHGRRRQGKWERWSLNLVRLYGHAQLRGAVPGFAAATLSMEMPDRNLGWCDVGAWTGLRRLCMAGNRLRDLPGLEHCRELRSLDLGRNPSLRLGKIFARLTGRHGTPPHNSLEHVFFAANPAKVTEKHIRRVLVTLGPHNSRLCVVDWRIPSVADRVHMYRRRFSRDEEEVERYRLQLALVQSATPFEGRRYHPHDVHLESNEQYAAAEVTQLLKMSGLGMTGRWLHLRDFSRLERLNLARNRISDITRIGLDELPELRYLDARNNRITTPKDELGRFVNDLAKLEAVALRGNLCMRNKGDRIRLIAAIPRMREVECTLRVIDTPISVDERVEAIRLSRRKAAGSGGGGNGGGKAGEGGEDGEESLRFRVALHMRAPPPAEVPPAEVRGLNLDGNKLRVLALAAFSGLEVLRLRDNLLQSLRGTGVEASVMPRLRVLDLRDNRLDSPLDCMRLVNSLPLLRFVGLAGNRFSDASRARVYRERFVGNAVHLRSVGCPLEFLDGTRITVDEIVAGWRAAGGTPEECAAFRFDVAVHRRLGEGVVPADVSEIDLSHMQLTHADLRPFAHLQRLNLAHNRLTLRSLKDSGVARLRSCREVSLSYNRLTDADLPRLGELVDRLASLESLHLVGNKCLPDNSAKARARFLAHVPGVDEQQLRLRYLNGRPVTVDERVAATRHRGTLPKKSSRAPAATPGQLEAVRLVLTLEEVRASLADAELDLSGRRLACLTSLRQFRALRRLNLSGNRVERLHGQGLGELPLLEWLDLRDNRLASLDGVLASLARCHALRHLWLAGSLADGSLDEVGEEERARVTGVLRGLRTLDGEEVPDPFTELQLDALRFLERLAGVGPNTLLNVDMAGKGVPAEFFFYVLAALKEMRCVETLTIKGNGWSQGAKTVANARQYCVHELGQRLRKLDGAKVIDEERLLAIRLVRQDVEKLGVNRLREWSECRHRALEKLEQHGGKLPYERKKKLGDNVDFIDFYVPVGGAGTVGATEGSGDNAGKEEAGAGAVLEKKEADADGGAGADAGADADGGAGDGSADAEADADADADADAGADGSPEASATAVAGGGAANQLGRLGSRIAKQGEIVNQVTGTFITKAEIFVHYVQVYALILVLDVNISWPDAFLDFSQWTKLGLVELDTMFSLDVPWQQQVKFGLIMSLPAVFLWFYVRLQHVDKDKWIDRYITGWKETRGRLHGSYMMALLGCLVLGFAADFSNSWRRVSSEHTWPSSQSMGVTLVGVAVVTVLFTVWMTVLRTFRKHRLRDRSANHEEFFEWWLQRIFMLRRLALFALTILFMPVSRVILSQFQCFCQAPEDVRDGELRCHIYPFPEQRCIPHEYSVLQGVAVLFACLYIVGIPAFFYKLIRGGVHQMVDIHGYADEAARANERAAELKKLIKADKNNRDARLKLLALRRDLKQYYFHKATSNRVPQTYLYAPYCRHYRYFKLLNMFQKLLLVVISLFFPSQFWSLFKVCVAFCVTFVIWTTTVAARPFNDGFENLLEGASQSANTVNLFSALGIGAGFVGEGVAATLLLAANGGTLVLFLISFLASPIILLRKNIMKKKVLGDAKKAANSLAASFSKDDLPAKQ